MIGYLSYIGGAVAICAATGIGLVIAVARYPRGVQVDPGEAWAETVVQIVRRDGTYRSPYADGTTRIRIERGNDGWVVCLPGARGSTWYAEYSTEGQVRDVLIEWWHSEAGRRAPRGAR